MIDLIVLKNFQKHRYLEIPLSRVTVIKAESDKGKSSVIRSVFWTAFNRPLGARELFIREGTKKVEVDLHVDGHILTRLLSSKKNAYFLDDLELEAVGKDVPIQVSSLLALSDLNFFRQHDGAFLLSMSKPEASRYLASLVGLEEMDRVQSEVEGGRKKRISKMEVHRSKIKEIRGDIKAMRFVPDMKKCLHALRCLGKKTEEQVDKSMSLSVLVNKLVSVSNTISELRVVMDADAALDSLYMMELDVVEIKKKRDSLHRLILELEQTDGITEQSSLLSQAEELLSSLTLLQGNIQTARNGCQRILGLINTLREIEKEISLFKNELSVLEQGLPDMCPTCGTFLKEGRNGKTNCVDCE